MLAYLLVFVAPLGNGGGVEDFLATISPYRHSQILRVLLHGFYKHNQLHAPPLGVGKLRFQFRNLNLIIPIPMFIPIIAPLLHILSPRLDEFSEYVFTILTHFLSLLSFSRIAASMKSLSLIPVLATWILTRRWRSSGILIDLSFMPRIILLFPMEVKPFSQPQ